MLGRAVVTASARNRTLIQLLRFSRHAGWSLPS